MAPSNAALHVHRFATSLETGADAGALRALLAEHRAALELIQFQEQRIANLAMTDELTGLKNRRGFLVLAEHHICLADRTKRPLVLFFADLDGLKRINDALGHAAGDEAIRCAARALDASFRSTDVVARFAGDELAVLAPECQPDAAEMLIERVQSTLASLPGQPWPLRLSIGHVVYAPANETLSVEELLQRADAAMYEKKRSRSRKAA